MVGHVEERDVPCRAFNVPTLRGAASVAGDAARPLDDDVFYCFPQRFQGLSRGFPNVEHFEVRA